MECCSASASTIGCGNNCGSGKSSSSHKLTGVKHIVLDIEGTTTPITFVKDVLFPYAADHVHSYLTETWATAQTQDDVAALAALAAADGDAAAAAHMRVSDAASAASAVAHFVRGCIAADRKVTALK